MSMVLGDLLAMIRQDYVDALLAEYKAQPTDSAVATALEPALRDDPALGVVLWGDLRVRHNGRDTLKTVASEGVFRFDERIVFDWGDALPGKGAPLQVVVLPFMWDAMAVHVAAGGPKPDWAALEDWLARWSMEPDADDQGDIEEQGRGVVHGCTVPFAEKEGYRFEVDMGTAPLDAWEDLLEAVLACGCVCVQIGG
jgi:hypothetical protein